MFYIEFYTIAEGLSIWERMGFNIEVKNIVFFII
jgi:hypothetical protein